MIFLRATSAFVLICSARWTSLIHEQSVRVWRTGYAWEVNVPKGALAELALDLIVGYLGATQETGLRSLMGDCEWSWRHRRAWPGVTRLHSRCHRSWRTLRDGPWGGKQRLWLYDPGRALRSRNAGLWFSSIGKIAAEQLPSVVLNRRVQAHVAPDECVLPQPTVQYEGRGQRWLPSPGSKITTRTVRIPAIGLGLYSARSLGST